MSGALIASTTAATPASVAFVTYSIVNTSTPTNYSVPPGTRIGDTVLFYSRTNGSQSGGQPPGSGWTNASGDLTSPNGVYVKKMATQSDLTAAATITSADNSSLAFCVYRGALSFTVVSGRGFVRSPYYAGVTFFGDAKPPTASGRVSLQPSGTASDILLPLNYIDGTDYKQYTAVEFLNQ